MHKHNLIKSFLNVLAIVVFRILNHTVNCVPQLDFSNL